MTDIRGEKREVRAPGGAAPQGPYSQGVIASGRHLFVSIDPGTGEVSGTTFEEQAVLEEDK